MTKRDEMVGGSSDLKFPQPPNEQYSDDAVVDALMSAGGDRDDKSLLMNFLLTRDLYGEVLDQIEVTLAQLNKLDPVWGYHSVNKRLEDLHKRTTKSQRQIGNAAIELIMSINFGALKKFHDESEEEYAKSGNTWDANEQQRIYATLAKELADKEAE
jgi:hypothetical protein